MQSHLPKMIRGTYDQSSDKFNLETTPSILLSRDDARRIIRDDATVYNYTENVRHVYLYVTEGVETVGDATEFAHIELKAGETVTLPRWVIKSGWALHATADANSAVNLLLSYDTEYTK